MSLLRNHLEQISACCEGIDSLPFPPPRIFTNAVLSTNDITSLIRDTEAHERALFSVPSPPPPLVARNSQNDVPSSQAPGASGASRRQTVFNVAGGEVTTGPAPRTTTQSRSHTTPSSTAPARRNTAVAAVLGGDLHSQITNRRPDGNNTSSKLSGSGDVDIEVLLHGAEKLCDVYPLPGALDTRIPAQRALWAQQSNTLKYYETKVAEQNVALEKQSRERQRWEDGEKGQGGGQDEEEDEIAGMMGGLMMTEEDLKQEEAEIRELDKRKKALQERLKGLDTDLGGVLR